MAIKVVANARGYFGKLREAGDEFYIQNKKQMGSWMTPVETSVPKGPASDKESESLA